MDAIFEKFYLHALTATAVAQAAAKGANTPVILVPLGSHEDHGPHLPMGDYRLADRLAGQIAARAAHQGVNALVAPTVPYGVADYFATSPGAMALSPASFKAVLEDLLGGLIAQGFTRIVILNGHGGNVPVIHTVTLALKTSRDIIVPSFYLWKIARVIMERQLGGGAANRFGHGAEPLASLSLALRPGLSDFQPVPARAGGFELGLPVSGFGTVNFAGLPVDVPSQFHQAPDDAICAAAPLASAALGEAVAAELVAAAASFVVHFAKVTSAC
ncbi:MAG: creatininase family protein [Acidocella sp.]|nr:creatininase family protein [Acidocella sp.]